MAHLPKGGLVRGRDKPIHGSCTIYFPGGIYIYVFPGHVNFCSCPLAEKPWQIHQIPKGDVLFCLNILFKQKLFISSSKSIGKVGSAEGPQKDW